MKKNTETDRDFLERIRRKLEILYGDRLEGVILFGSRARGDGDEDSDVDLLVLLDGPVDFGAEVRAMVDALYDLQIENEVTIEALPVDAESYEERGWPLYRLASEEGLRL